MMMMIRLMMTIMKGNKSEPADLSKQYAHLQWSWWSSSWWWWSRLWRLPGWLYVLDMMIKMIMILTNLHFHASVCKSCGTGCLWASWGLPQSWHHTWDNDNDKNDDNHELTFLKRNLDNYYGDNWGEKQFISHVVLAPPKKIMCQQLISGLYYLNHYITLLYSSIRNSSINN